MTEEASSSEDYQTLWKGTVTVSVANVRELVSKLNLQTYTLDSVTCSSKSDYARKNLEWSCEVSVSRREPGRQSTDEFHIALLLTTAMEEEVLCLATQSSKSETVTEMAKKGNRLKLVFNTIFSPYESDKSAQFSVNVMGKTAFGAPPSRDEALSEYLRALSTPVDEYIWKMFNSQEFSDVTIQTRESEFFAHKLILGQSPVFAKMLQTPMKEGLSSVIEIKDVDPSLVELMLESLYKRVSVYIPNIPEEKGQLLQLLDLAERYDLPGLKNSCFEKMALTLSDENAAEFNVAARRYSRDERVRESFKESCRRRMQTIGQTEGSKQLIQANWDAFF